MGVKKLLIGGEWRETKETFAVKNPYSGEQIAEVSTANPQETEESIALAETAAGEMRNLPRYEIAKGLRQIADGIEKRKKEFTETIAAESAKPLKTAQGEVERGIATFNWAAPKGFAAKSCRLTRLRPEKAKPRSRNAFLAA
jgi:acyl-CoA reductase-like NAD-dependent aldehyde dehydrogenase